METNMVRSAAPGPWAWPLVGNLPSIQRQGLVQFLESSWRRHGDVFRVNLGFPAVVVAHPEGIKRVLAGRADNYVKGHTYDGVRRVIGNGLLALEGERWRSRRRLIQPAFHKTALAKMTHTMVEVGSSFFARWERRAQRHWLTVDAHREMVALTLEVVVSTLFGRELSEEARVSHEALSNAMELITEGANRIVLPAWVPTPHNRKFHRTMEEVEGAVYRVIEAARGRGGPDPTLLGMLLAARDADTGQALDDRAVRDEVFTMFVAGHETTALTLSWMFTLLTPSTIERMREEVTRVLGTRPPTFEDFGRLSYLRQVIDETLRLRGPVAMNARSAVAEDLIQGFRIRAGDVVLPYFWAVHRHPVFWDRPEQFDPLRFSPQRQGARHPWCYLPFSGGQRVCIGNMFSLVESVMLTALLLQRFEFELVPGQRIEPVAMATLRPSAPIRLRVRPLPAQGTGRSQ